MSSIRLKRSAEPGKVPSLAQLDLGEVAINTHDGKIFFKRDQGGELTIKQVGARDATDNVYYVTKTGSNSNDGKTIGDGWATLEYAVQNVPENSTIYVKSGVHTIDNPIIVPAFVAIVGDSLRTTVIQPKNKTQDMFWVRTGAFLKDMRLVGHESPAAAVAFPKLARKEVIYTSPYVQNCTSETTTGTGMRIDGDDVEGLKSMVVDAYTQYNQGGIGIHHLNGGNSQLVSVFTICCDIAILCESGGFCSLTNSNSSFGNIGLQSDGISPVLYEGTAGAITGTSSLIINDLTNIPYIQNVANFTTNGQFYTIAEATPLKIGKGIITGPTLTNESADLRTARTTVLDQKEVLQKQVIDYVDEFYPTLNYNEAKCYRDAGLIIEAVLDDMVLGSNYRSYIAARTYYRSNGIVLPADQKAETIDAIEKLKVEVLELLTSGTTAYNRISANFDIIIAVLNNGLDSLPTPVFPDPTGVLPEIQRAKTAITLNKNFLIEEAIKFINNNYPLLGYDRALCERDVGLVIDAIGWDLMFKSNFRSITAGRSYYREGAAVVTADQKTATLAAFTELKRLALATIKDDEGAQVSVAANMDLIINILDNGLTAVPASYTIPDPTGYNTTYLVGFGDTRDNIDANRDFIKAEVTAFIDANYPNLVYDEAACLRDLDYILDAIYYDLTYGGNLETTVAGLAYYSQSVLQLGSAGEKTATLAAYGYLSTLVEEIGGNVTLASPLQNVVTQVAGTTPANTNGAVQAGALIDDIITYIADDSSDPTVVEPSTSWVATALVVAYNELQAAKSGIQTQITTYIESNFAYDQDICRRDFGLIIDGIIYDTLYKGNSQSFNVGIQYYSGGKLQFPTLQRDATGDALSFLSSKIQDVLRSNTTIPLQTVVLQDASTLATTSSEINRISGLFNIVESVVRRGYFINAFIDEVGPDFASQGNPAVEIRDTILASKEKLQVDTIKFLNRNFTEFKYDQAICSRDVGFIIDAVAMDAALGTNYNSIIAGLSYQRANVSINKVRTQQLEQTLRAIAFVKGEVAAIPGLDDITILRTNAGFDEILDIIENNTPNTIIFPSPTGVSDDLVDAKAQLQANKDFIKAEVIAYINNEFQNFTYDQAKCERDLGLILDAVSLDVALNTNYNSIVAGRAYRRANASEVIGSQLIQTVGAIKKARDIIDNIDDSSIALSVLGRARAVDLFNEVLSLIENGTSSVIELNTPGNATQEQVDAKDQIVSNRDFIRAEIIAFINLNYPGITYDEEKCSRDVDYIIDAVGHDILYGGTYATVQAAEAYYEGAVLQLGAGQTAATVAAYQRLSVVLQTIARNIAVIRTTGNTLEQVDEAGIAGSNETDKIDELITIIIDAINDGSTANIPAPILPSITWAEQSIQDDYAVIQLQKLGIIAEVIQFITDEYQNFVYDQAKCSRDVDFILDGLSYDILYGGNSATHTVTRSYFSFNTNQLGTGETSATITAYEHLKSVIQDVVLGQTVTATTGNNETQNVDSSNAAATQAEATALGELMDIIIDALRLETANNIPSKIIPDITWTGYTSDFNAIISRKAALQADTITFINNRYTDFDYNQFKCSRDVGLILDAVTSDMVMGTNYRSRLAGNSYYRQSAREVIDAQLFETVEAIKFVKAEALKLVNDASTLATPEYTSLVARFDDVINILATGEENAPSIAYNTPVGATVGQVRAKDILQANRQFFVEEAVAFISETFPMLGYDRALCERDVGLIIDALGYDLMFGSNFRSIVAGRSYYRKGSAVVIESQKAATIAAYERLKQLAVAAVDDAGAKTSIEDNMDLIINILENGITAIPTNYTIPTPTGGSNNASDSGYLNARNLIDSNRDFIIQEIFAYIEQNFATLDYDRAVCQRDVGLVIDALVYDLIFGSNFRSITAGRSYYREGAAVVTTSQKEATLAAFRELKRLVAKIVAPLSSTAEESVQDNSDIIINILQNGLSAVPAYVIPTPTGGTGNASNSVRLTARNNIEANREFVTDEVIAYITENYPGLSYDQVACERDVGYILDAVFYDLTYGGNLETVIAGRAYYSAGQLQLGVGEETATIDAYTRLREVLGILGQGGTVTPTSGNATAQASVTANGSFDVNITNDLIDTIITFINDDSTDPAEVAPDETWVATELTDSKAAVLAQRATLQTDITTYIDSTFASVLGYDRELCERDVGLVIDALGFDLMFGSNFRSITAARSYYREGAAVVTTGQKVATIAAFTELKRLAQAAVTDAGAKTSIGNNMDLIINVLDNGLSAIPTNFTIPDPTGYNTTYLVGFGDARDNIDANRAFITAEIIEYIAVNFSGLVYDQAACERDLSLILDAIFYDLTYGGNLETSIAGRAYYSQSVLQLGSESEKTATLAAYGYLSTLVEQIALNQDVEELQVVETQVTAGLTAATAGAATQAGALIDDIITFISDDSSEPTAVAPGTDWVASSLTAANNQLQSSKATIQAAITQFVEENFAYVKATCARDVDYILDALYYDLTYGGNLETLVAGRSYYSKGLPQLGTGEEAATLAAYGYLSTLVEQIALSQDVEELQVVETQVTGTPGSAAAATQAGALIDDIITFIAADSSEPAAVLPDTSWVAAGLTTAFDDLQAEKSAIQTNLTIYIEANFAYKEAVCRRDVGFIVDAITYDILYSGNRETIDAGDEYFSAGTLQIPAFTKKATADTFAYLKEIAADAVRNINLSPLQTVAAQVTNLTAATATDANRVTELFDIVVNLLEHGYSSTITFDTRLQVPRPKINEPVTFHQPSLITASGHTFEWVGSGNNINSALPYQGGQPIAEKQVIETNNGRVFFTSTDQKGDFKIGNQLTIERATGTISGQTFDRSLFAVLTPYILSLEG
jgi:hypothetical protein